MKKNLIQMAVAITLFLSASPTAFGQELIRKAVQQICDTSIIRAKNNDTSLVYNLNIASSFMLMKPSASTIFASYIDPLYVNDFIIDKQSVIFCGYIRNNGKPEKLSVVGRFPLASFPTAQINYYVFEPCEEFKKMDSYTITDIYGNIEKHLVLTGTTTGIRSDALVDMTLFSSIPSPPTYSNFFAFFSNDGNESLDDVVVTDSLVVVSTRNIVQGLPVIDFLHINKPYSMGQSIFSFPVNHLTLGSPVADSPVLLEHETNNKYAATFKNSGSHTMSMLQLTGPSIVNNCLRIFMDNYETDIPMELKYNRFSSVYDLLAHHYSARNPDYYLMFQIYHITPDVINNIVPYGDITFFNNSTVWSIDPTKNAYFVASGDSTNYPKWFRYKHDTWENCPRPSAYEYFNEKLPSKDYQTDRLFFEGFFYREEKLIPIPFTIDISNTCKQ